MTSSRKQPGVAFWATVVVVVVLLAYPLSFGPACWVAGESKAALTVVGNAYFPVIFVISRSPRSVKNAFNWYLGLWTDDRIN